MKSFKELVSEMSVMQRIKRSISSKKTAKRRSIRRALNAKKPPTPEKIKASLERELRKKALSIADKQGVYTTAAAGTKEKIEKKASKLLAKKKGVWTTKLRPEVKKRMKDAFKSRTSSKNPEQ